MKLTDEAYIKMGKEIVALMDEKRFDEAVQRMFDIEIEVVETMLDIYNPDPTHEGIVTEGLGPSETVEGENNEDN